MAIQFGVDYYPEHWPVERWQTDARMMREMGIDVVRMAEFSWHKMEPQEGQYDFAWLERAVELLGGEGIKTVLGTPTAAPPAWLVRKHPEVLPVDSQGRRVGFGGRHHDCQSNGVYRKYAANIVRAMAKRFANNPNVIGWQTDNEFGNSHDDLCFCDSCEAAFQHWLEEKYGTVQELNRVWGTHFWSQEYNSFGEVFAPRFNVTAHSPSLLLDWKRFCSDLIVDFQQQQVDILRAECPNQFITHNAMGFADKVSYYDLARPLDFISHDQYISTHFNPGDKVAPDRMAAQLDVVRGFKERPFWIMEQQAGQTGWETLGRQPAPGQLALWAQQSIAHGADVVVFFRWRSCSVGTEQYWHGILPHDGRPGRRYTELQKMIHTLRPVMPQLQGAMPEKQAAIVYSYDQLWAFKAQPHNPALGYVEQLQKYYSELYRCNIPTSFVADTAELAGYKVVIAPMQFLSSAELAGHYKQYVEQGGCLVLTMRSGVKNWEDLCYENKPLPGPLKDLVGAEVEEYDCLKEETVQVNWDGAVSTGAKWADILLPEGAQVLAEYASEFYEDKPAITCNRVGKGMVLYVGVEPEQALMEQLVQYLTQAAGLSGLGATPEGVELAARSKDGTDFLFVLNHEAAPQPFAPQPGWTLLTGNDGEMLAPFEARIYSR